MPSHRKSKRIVRFIRSLKPGGSCVDYGCGKLRHIHEMLAVFDRVTVVDSSAQIDKEQMIHGELTNIRKFTKNFGSRVQSYATHETAKIRRRHDWTFIINVLSAIPYHRARIDALRKARSLLRRGGQTLIVSQFENSKFENFEKGEPHLDGYLYRTCKGLHFFGRIPKRTLLRYLSEAGFTKPEVRSVKGYFFVVAKRS